MWRSGRAFQGRWIEQQERYFVARCRPFEIVTDNMEEYEFSFMAEHRWWLADEVAASDDWFVPRTLAEHLPGIVAGRFPSEPFDVGV